VINSAEPCWRPELKRNVGAVNSCLPPWQPPRRRWDGYRESWRRGGKAWTRGTQPGSGVHQRFYRPSRKEEEGAPGITGVLSSSPLARIFTVCPYLPIPSTSWAGNGTNHDEVGRRWWVCWRSDPLGSTVPWHTYFSQMNGQSKFKPLFSDFQMATHPVTYSKIVELYTIYNSTIGTELI
jgi:hypothetical protein